MRNIRDACAVRSSINTEKKRKMYYKYMHIISTKYFPEQQVGRHLALTRTFVLCWSARVARLFYAVILLFTHRNSSRQTAMSSAPYILRYRDDFFSAYRSRDISSRWTIRNYILACRCDSDLRQIYFHAVTIDSSNGKLSLCRLLLNTRLQCAE